MALSRKFHWVEVNRDHQPDLPKRFGVNAYPSLITIGDNQEKIHRFKSHQKPAELIANLENALRRHALYRAGEEWDEPDPRPDSICEEGTVELIPAPSEGVPSGMVFHDGALWVVQDSKLHRLGESAAHFDIPKSVRDLCTDGKRLYAMDYGWTAGRPLREIDPQTGKVTREIVTEANLVNRAFGAAGMVWLDGKLWVLEGMHGRLNAVDPATGEVTRVLQTEERWLTSLAHDGTHFIAGSRKELLWIDPKDGSVARRVAVNYPIRCLTFHDGALYLMEQPVFGHDKEHKRIRLWPRKTVIYKLTLR